MKIGENEFIIDLNKSQKELNKPEEINNNNNNYNNPKKDKMKEEANESIFENNKSQKELLSEKPEKEKGNELNQDNNKFNLAKPKTNIKYLKIKKDIKEISFKIKGISKNSESIDKFIKEKEKISDNNRCRC